MDLYIGRVVKRLRLEMGITQEQLAERLGITGQAVSKWESAAALPDITLLPELASFFGVAVDDLFSVVKDDHMERIDRILRDDHGITHENFTYATRILRRALEEDPKDIGAYKRLAGIHGMRRNRDSITELNLLEKIISISPFDVESHDLLYHGRLMRLEYDRQILFYERFVGEYSGWQPGYRYLVGAYIHSRKPDKATATVVRGLELGDDLPLRLKLAEIKLLQYDIDGAKGVWESLIKEYPQDARVYEAAAEGYANLEDFDRAFEAWEKAYLIDPANLSPLYGAAFQYDKIKEFEKAIGKWDQIIQGMAEHHGITDGELVDWPRREIDRLRMKGRGEYTAY